MKKIIVIVLCFLTCIVNVKAECTDANINEWANKVKIVYKTSQGNRNAEYLYYLYLEPARDDIVIKSTNSLYSGITDGIKMENGEYGIPSYIHFEEKTYTIGIYVKESSKVCPGEKIKELVYTVPQYNSYSDSAYCEQYPESSLCSKMSNVNDLKQEEFLDKMESYIKSKNQSQIKEKSLIWKIVFNYLIWIIIPCGIVASIFLLKIKKVKRDENEK